MRLRLGFTFLTCTLGVLSPSRATAADIGSQPAVKTVPGFDIEALDRSVDPCVDFYQFACGTWRQTHPIPPDQPRWGRFNELQDRNRALLRELLEQASQKDAKRTPVQRQIGDDYAACMDEAGAEARGAGALKLDLDAIAALQDKAGLPVLLARLHQSGTRGVFNFGAAQDFKDATMNRAALDQGGLGLPDRDYYLKDDPKSVELRKKYVQHLRNSFVLLGESDAQAQADADSVLATETGLAQIAMERVKRRDPQNRYNPRSTAELAALVPSFAWARYFEAAGAPAFKTVNVTSLPFFEGLDARLAAVDLPALKTYLRWHALRHAAPLLSARFVNENFDFYGRTLSGTQELSPRWKRCVDTVDGDLGQVLGQLYVERAFGADGQARTRQLVAGIEKALGRNLDTLPWMTADTRKQALAKLAAISNNVGFPDKWRDYSTVEIRRDDPLGNDRRTQMFEWRREMAKIDAPADRKEWRMTAPTVNAFYQSANNSINFPAGILQPPFFDRSLDDAVNYGAIGAVIGHELTHGFDDSGRKFDGSGNMTDWWTAADATEFEKRTQCLVDQYSSYTAVDEVKLNGRLTLGENTADNGGVRVALMALQESQAGKPAPPKDGFSPEQRLFLGYGQIWCQNSRPEDSRLRAQTDPHSPGQWRVNGVVSNLAEFGQAFGCKAGQPMVRENACRVW
jgi:putative endopeptidase